jgi:hypothetical protein
LLSVFCFKKLSAEGTNSVKQKNFKKFLSIHALFWGYYAKLAVSAVGTIFFMA